MSGDLEARVVQAAREAVAQVIRDEPGQPSPETIACVLAGRLDHTQAVRFAILGARAALAEIERDGVVVPRDAYTRPTCTSLPPRMIVAGIVALKEAYENLQNYDDNDEIDWDDGSMAIAVYRAMIAAVPRK